MLVPLPTGFVATDVSTAEGHACAYAGTSRTAICWGNNGANALGLGDFDFDADIYPPNAADTASRDPVAALKDKATPEIHRQFPCSANRMSKSWVGVKFSRSNTNVFFDVRRKGPG